MKLIDVAFVPFPEAVHGKMAGVATRNEQKHRYQILIDNLNPAEVQQKCLRHEYGHIMLGHLEEPEPEYPSPEFDAREKAADDYADSMPDSVFNTLLSISNIVHRDKVPEVVTA